ncbi:MULTISPECIES: nuclear transport factor 2 family protein [Parafrankia]|uniref:Polyketide cyclase n=1 Tax=Parafrankia colletiae TaxID=573497 RepID=A0A1S1QWP5_9ACTN|nr:MULTISPECIES: nuclear transport factor 2 family protein [Parafrankia]MCK9899604.1 nuclear transport factor 2 family protein [Frankia sp. Cpl3]OHV37969.1 polyketide cyclase [Parafrankia colletiae]TCJ32993.1 nuclear transport factor 2 family protein [Parafrankia sp. BMG5.11]
MSDIREDRERICDVVLRYATGIDQRDWNLLRTCWTPEVEADYGAFGQFTSADALTETMARTHENMGPTFHRISNIVIEIDGDQASVRSYVHGVLMVTPDDPGNWVDVIGSYEDVLIRTTEGWRISRRIARTARTLTASTALRTGSGLDGSRRAAP